MDKHSYPDSPVNCWLFIKHYSANPNDLEFLAKLLEKGVLKPVIDRRYPLDRAADAMNYLSQGHSKGKVVINIES